MPTIASDPRPIPANVPLLLTIPEATRLLSIGRTTLYKLIALRQIKLVKVAGASRVVRSSLDNYLREIAAGAMAARARRGDGSIRYDRKAKAYVGRLSLWVEGKRERPSATGRTYTECRTALRKLQESIESGGQSLRRNQECVASYLDDWLATQTSRRRR